MRRLQRRVPVGFKIRYNLSGGMPDDSSACVLELSNLGQPHAPDWRTALVEISRGERHRRTHCPIGRGAVSQRFRRLHEHADRSKSAAGAHYESMAHPVAGFPSECGLDLLRFDGADACSRRIFDAGAKAPTAGLNRAARCAQICWLRGGKCWLASNIASEIGSRIPRV